MPRRATLAMGGVPWHIIQRDNSRSACFFNDVDYHRYLTTLFNQSKVWNCEIHAYVLMTNHMHLLVTPAEAEGPGLLMKHLGQRYVLPRQLSFKHTIQLWQGYQGFDHNNPDLSVSFLRMLGQVRVGHRAGRVEPRALKRRPKGYPLLMVPREVAKQKIRLCGHPKKLK